METLLLLSVLGLVASAPHDHGEKIMGGNECPEHSTPWIASLITTFHVCGGSLIEPNWVLTAAHCNESGLTVRLGEHDLSKREGTEQYFKVDGTFIHPQYNPRTLDNDIMLLRLSRTAAINNNVRPVRLPTTCPTAGEMCLVSGWGLTMDENKDSNKLQCLNIPIVTHNACQRAYPGMISSDMMCIGDMDGGKDACSGDSGGPAVINDTLQGIVSWGYKCGMRNHPGVYTMVCKYTSWILHTIQNN